MKHVNTRLERTKMQIMSDINLDYADNCAATDKIAVERLMRHGASRKIVESLLSYNRRKRGVVHD